jgi:hypothetical protein
VFLKIFENFGPGISENDVEILDGGHKPFGMQLGRNASRGCCPKVLRAKNDKIARVENFEGHSIKNED